MAYYYTEDEDEAVRLIAFLKAMNIPNVDEKPTKLRVPLVRDTFDVWIAFP